MNTTGEVARARQGASAGGRPWLGAAALVALLAGCGGGGGGGKGTGPGELSPPTEATVRGTVATGAPLGGAQVQMKCADSPSRVFVATVDPDGVYELRGVPTSAGPCLLRAARGQQRYGSALAAVGAAAVTANITPLTHLQVTRLLGQDAAAAFDSADAATLRRITRDSLSAAKGDVLAQLNRLGMDSATLSPDWIGQGFAANPSDQMDRTLEELQGGLRRAGLTVETATGQLAASDAALQLPANWQPTHMNCRPGLISGFNGEDRSKWIKVREAMIGGDGPGGDGGAGAGAGGGLGQFLDVTVMVEFSDGTRLGPVKTDTSKGMVTIVPCELAQKVPALVRFYGEAGAKYYDEGRRELVSFEGEAIHGVINRFEQDKNIAVTSFTEAVYRRMEQLAWRNETAGGYRLKAVGQQPWKDTARIQMAHDEVLAAVNDQLPGIYRLTELDRMPITLNQHTDVEGSEALPKTEIGIHGAALAAFAKTAASRRPNDPAPALTITKDFAEDLADGLMDNPLARLASQGPIAPGTSVLPSYGVENLWEGMSMNTTATGIQNGVENFRSDEPFPYGLRKHVGFRNSDKFRVQFQGLFSDGVFRIVAEVHDGDNGYGYCEEVSCEPARRVRSVLGEPITYWVFEYGSPGEYEFFDIERGELRNKNGNWFAVSAIFEHLEPGRIAPFAPARSPDEDFLSKYGATELRNSIVIDYYYGSAFVDPEEQASQRLYGIDAGGNVVRRDYRINYDLPYALVSEMTIHLPARVRQLSRAGNDAYALLTDGQVYQLNPDQLVAKRLAPEDPGYNSPRNMGAYVDLFMPTQFVDGDVMEIPGASNGCWLGGVYLTLCDGRLVLLNRLYHIFEWGPGRDSRTATQVDVQTQVIDVLNAAAWRAEKYPGTVQLNLDWDHYRLLADQQESYRLESDLYGVAVFPSDAVRSGQIDRVLVRSWLGVGANAGGAL